MKTYFNAGTLNVWQVIEDLETIGLQIKAMTSCSITVATGNGFSIAQLDKLMANRGFF